jgi:citrate synthase
MLQGKMPDDVAVRALDTYMIALAEDGLNISTFVACAVASTQNDLYATVSAALATLKGQLHGRAGEQAMHTFQAIGTPDQAAAYIDGMLQRKEPLMGVGHYVFETEDPRVRHIRQQSQALLERANADDRTHMVAERVAEIVEQHTFFRKRHLHPNVEFFSAPLLYQLGFPPDYFTAVLACAHISGWIAHVHEQLMKPRLMRPQAAYAGKSARPFVPLAERG